MLSCHYLAQLCIVRAVMAGRRVRMQRLPVEIHLHRSPIQHIQGMHSQRKNRTKGSISSVPMAFPSSARKTSGWPHRPK